MTKKNELKKAKQAGRREARIMAKEYLDSLEPSFFAKHYVKVKPKWIPFFIRNWVTSIVINLKPGDHVRIKLTPKQIYHILTGDEVVTNWSRIIVGDVGNGVIKSIFNQVMRENAEKAKNT